MKTKLFSVLLGTAFVAIGCVKTVTGSHTAAIPFERDKIEGRYERTPDQVYRASVIVIQKNGVVTTEYIPHDTTNSVRALQGKVNQRDVWVRVEAVDPRVTSVVVQTRTGGGGSDLNLAHELEKEIALQLTQAQ